MPPAHIPIWKSTGSKTRQPFGVALVCYHVHTHTLVEEATESKGATLLN